MGVGGLHTCQVHRRGVKINQFHHAVADAGVQRNIFRRLDQQRHAGQAILKAVLRLFRQVKIAGKIAVVAQEEDCTVIVNALFFQSFNQLAELDIDLHAHAKIYGAQFVPVGISKVLHSGILADLRLHQGLAGAVICMDPLGQLGTVNGGKIRFLHPVRRVGINQAQKHTERLVGRAVMDPLDSGIHYFVIAVIVLALGVAFQLALIMGVIIFVAGLPALVGVHITGALLFLAAVINFGRMAFRPAGDLACGQVVAVVHPNVITGLFQLFQHAGLTGAQQVAHGAVAAHMGIQAGKKAAPAGHADRVLAVCLPKGHRLMGRKGIQIRGDGCRVAQVGQRIAAHFIRVKNNDVWSLCHTNLLVSGPGPRGGIYSSSSPLWRRRSSSAQSPRPVSSRRLQ